MMGKTQTCKSFKLEIGEGGKHVVTVDDKVIPHIADYHICYDAEDLALDIELWVVDENGTMDILNLLMAL